MLAHEIVTARPYAFLDDEEFQNRRTNAVRLRRGLSVDLASIGALDPEAIEQVHAEIVPEPESADDLHDLLSSLVAVPARTEWRPLWDAARRPGPGPDASSATAPSCGARPRRPMSARLAFAGDDDAAVRMVRGHLELSGITTAAQLAAGTALPPARVAFALAALQQEGFVLQGRYIARRHRNRWVARRLLARMHSYSRRSRRESVRAGHRPGLHALPAALAARRARHPAGRRRRLVAGHRAVAGLRSGGRGLGARAAGPPTAPLQPGLAGPAVPRRRGGLAAPRSPGPGPTPTARWAPRPRPRRSRWCSGPICRGCWTRPRGRPPPLEPTVGATAEIIDTLRQRGASFASDLAGATRRLADDIERGLWEGVARGLVMCDGFGAIRARVAADRSRPVPRRLSPPGPGRPHPGRPGSAGRWALVPSASSDTDREELAEAVAEQLLNRWGVVFRDLAGQDSLRLPWRDLQWALRRLEDRGLVRGGRFVTGFSGEQYALPAAAEQLAHVRKTPRTGERVVVNATDPLNLVGLIVPGDAVPAVRTNRVVYVDGLPEQAAPSDVAPRRPVAQPV